MNLLLICSGNTCRSVMAEALGRSQCPGHQWRSRGLNVESNTAVPPHALTALGDAGQLVADHVPAPLTAADLEWADTVYAMTDSQVRQTRQMFGAAVVRLAALADIGDPFGADLETYRGAADTIASALTERFGSGEP